MSAASDILDGLSGGSESLPSKTRSSSRPAGGRTLGELVGTIGPLRASDLESYRANGPGSATQTERISWRHHRIAQLMALGTHTQLEIAELTGLTPQRISALSKSPAFIALVEEYQNELFTEDGAFQLGLIELRGKALEQVRSDLEDGIFRGKDAGALLKELMDRTGHGPKKTIEAKTSHLHVDARDLMDAHHQQRARIIEDPIDVSPSPPPELEKALAGLPGMGGANATPALPAPEDPGSLAGTEGGSKVREARRSLAEEIDRFEYRGENTF